MPRWITRAGYAAFALFASLLIWRAFFYHAPHPAPGAQPATTVSAAPPAAMPITESDLILDLFNPSDTALATQQAQSTLVRQIEEAITANFLLRRCNLIDETAYRDTSRALALYIQRTGLAADAPHAQAELERIIASASASYSLIYSRSRCDAPQLPATAAKLEGWRRAMLGD
jgi:hypothetical protein